ncbi:MAG TPA: DUF3467 domain-containing protein [Candidatus Kapabacteria bacterium]|jgi:hypothetical protein
MPEKDSIPPVPMQQQLQVELGEKEAEGTYSNLAIITHSPAEFIIDFTRVTPGVPRARVLSRIIMTPQHFKLLLNAMRENIERFEQQYGEIRTERLGEHPFGFRTSGPGTIPGAGGETVH